MRELPAPDRLNSMWRLAFALVVLLLALLVAVAGTRSHQIFDTTWTGRAGATSAANALHR